MEHLVLLEQLDPLVQWDLLGHLDLLELLVPPVQWDLQVLRVLLVVSDHQELVDLPDQVDLQVLQDPQEQEGHPVLWDHQDLEVHLEQWDPLVLVDPLEPLGHLELAVRPVTKDLKESKD